MPLRKLDHYNIDTAKPDETVRFYCDVLGCEDGSHVRPDSGFPGTWLLVDGHPAIHINFLDVDNSGSTGAFNHIAFEGQDYLGMRAHLDSHGVKYRVVESPKIDLCQIFLRDPNQVRVEINIRGETAALAAHRAETGTG